jgi:hypothetical protein
MSGIQHAVLVALGALSLQLNAQDGERVIRVAVTDLQGNPVPFATVSLSRERTYAADTGGMVRVRISANSNPTISVRRIGFRPGKVEAQSLTDSIHTIQLEPLPQFLSRELVVAERQLKRLEVRGFYERMNDKARGILTGYFITPDQIEERKYIPRLTSLLGDIPSIRVRTDGNGNNFPAGVNGCVMAVYLDGQRLTIQPAQSLRGGAGPAGPGEGIDYLVATTSIAGIEVYPRGGQMPPQYQLLNGSCGAVLIWTR